MKYFSFTVCLLLLLTLSCNEEKAEPTRSFYMGFTPFPHDLALASVQETYSNITTNGDMINHHFDNGVPWVEALNGEPFSDNIMNDWNFRKSLTPATHKVYVSVGALNIDRNGMARYRGESDDMDLPSPWDSYAFNSNQVKTAYVNYCKRTIEFFNPDYFNMGIEANLLHFINPAEWSEYIEFHTYVYQELKTAYPNLPVFCSITGAHLLEGYFDGNDISLQRLAALQLLEYSDLYALSFYPYMSKFMGNPYPSESFDQLFAISSKPVAFAETGYPAETFTMNVNNVPVTFESDAAKQKKYTEDVLNACNKRNALFVINFVIRDYDQLWEEMGEPDDIGIAWRDTGLIDGQGQEREALSVWRGFLDRPLK
jgi:hypothetical protein